MHTPRFSHRDRVPTMHQPNTTASDHAAPALIKVRAEDRSLLFDAYDPAPLRERRISEEANAFVAQRARNAPKQAPLRVRVLLPSHDAACCDDVQTAFQQHFARCEQEQRVMMRSLFREGAAMAIEGIAVALVLVTVARLLAGSFESVMVEKIANGLSLIVWVILWRPADMLIYDWVPIRKDRRLYARLAAAPVDCIVAEDDNAGSHNGST
ncbi:MAG: hypothetical protein EA379_03365 [Phycisphaerales bacterium]|nr:MAG: hypothetical protein EA379_03365 [Phycisphaerales bacterium]